MKARRLLVIQRALEGSETLSPAERADLLDGVGLLMRGWAKHESEAAFATARAIRDAETLQLNFMTVLKQTNP